MLKIVSKHKFLSAFSIFATICAIALGATFIDILMVIAFFGFIAILGYAEEKYKKFTETQQNKSIEQIRGIIEEDGKTLGIERKKRKHIDSYGITKYGDWEKEVAYYYANVFIPKWSKRYPIEISEQIRNAALVEIERIAQKYENDSQRNSNYSDLMSGSDYEEFCAELLTATGWEVRKTRATGDQGVDIIAKKYDYSVGIQCKKYSNSVGNSAVQEIIAGVKHYGLKQAIVVSNSNFTKSAQQLAESNSVILTHHDRLTELEALLRN